MQSGLKRQNRLGSVLCKWDHTGPYILLTIIPFARVLSSEVLFRWVGQPVFQPGRLHHVHTPGPLVVPGGTRAGMCIIFHFGVFAQTLQASSRTLALLAIHPQTHTPFPPSSSPPDRTHDAEGLCPSLQKASLSSP